MIFTYLDIISIQTMGFWGFGVPGVARLDVAFGGPNGFGLGQLDLIAQFKIYKPC